MPMLAAIALLLIVLTAAVSLADPSPPEAPQPHIAQYKHDKTAAFSFTFDDGWKGQVDNTLAILDPLDIKGTFFFMPLAMEKTPKSHATWADAKRMQANGHEIGTHAKIKPRLHEIDADQVRRIVNGGYELIKDKTGIAPVSFAMPGGSQLTDAVKQVIHEKHAFIRKPSAFDQTFVRAWGGSDRRPWDEQREQQFVQSTIEDGKWQIVVIHAIVAGYRPFPSKDAFKSICTWVKQQDERLWVAPMGTVGRYIAARKASALTVHERTDSSCQLTVTLTADAPIRYPQLFSEPLTVVIPVKVAADATVTATTADGKALAAHSTGEKLLIDVPAGSGRVSVRW